MIDFLLGVPSKLKAISDHLTTYWTSTRAAKLDLLTVAPAPASTALSNATWTGALATILGNTIQTSVIRSIQKGTVVDATTTAGSGIDLQYRDIAITAVADINKCVCLIGGNVTLSASRDMAIQPSARLTSTTNLRVSTPDALWVCAYQWTVVEFK